MQRLHKALLASDVDSQVYCVRNDFDPSAASRLGPGLKRFVCRAQGSVYRRLFNGRASFALLGSGLVNAVNRIDCDVIHLHWINNEMLSVREIARIEKPVVWTCHDLWPASGIKHYPCETFEGRFVTLQRQLDRHDKNLKMKHWRDAKLHFVCVSKWEASLALQAAWIDPGRLSVLPNPIDTRVFYPVDKTEARDRLGIPADRPIVLFGAHGNRDPRKGADLLRRALESRRQIRDHALVCVFGEGAVDLPAGYASKAFGYIREDGIKRLLYSAADVMCVPSRQETFGQTALEALACGTPAVVFAGSGLDDIVEHMQSGWRAEPYNTAHYAQGVIRMLEAERGKYAEACRMKADAFSHANVVPEYMKLYASLI